MPHTGIGLLLHVTIIMSSAIDWYPTHVVNFMPNTAKIINSLYGWHGSQVTDSSFPLNTELKQHKASTHAVHIQRHDARGTRHTVTSLAIFFILLSCSSPNLLAVVV